MDKIDSGEECCLSKLSDIECHIEPIKQFNNVRKKVFGNNLEAGWKKAIRDFSYAYKQIPNITKPLKVHIVIAHVCDFIEKYGNGRGLGFYSVQTGEALHHKFETIFDKYYIKNIYSKKYGQNLYKAVVKFSSFHL